MATENGIVVFPPGERAAVILVPIVQQGQRRYSEWFGVEITDAPNAEIGPIASAAVVIVSARSTPDTEPDTESDTASDTAATN